jgi:hypothetical protein
MSKSQGQKFLYQWKGLVTRNINVKYDSSSTYQLKDIAKVKVIQ